MAKGRYLLRKAVKKEAAKVSKAASKRGSWAKIGASLGGLLAIGLTGGAAAPLVAAGMAGMGTYLGGKAGAALSGTKKDLTGGRFLHGSKENVKEMVEQQTQKSAITSFATAGMTRFMGGSPLDKLKEGGSYSTKGGLSFDFKKMLGKGGVEGAAKEGAGKSLKSAFSLKPDASQVHEYGDTLLGKIGKTLDIKGSAIGGKVGKMMHPGGWTGMELEKMGEESLGTRSTLFGEGEYGASADFPQQPSRRHAQFAPGEMTDKMKGSVDTSSISMKDTGGPYYGDFDDPGQYARNRPVVGSFAEDELYDWSGDVADIGSRSSAYEVKTKQDIFRNEYLERQPPNVPIDFGEDDFSMNVPLNEADFGTATSKSTFAETPKVDYSNYQMGPDNQRVQEQAKSQAEARYLHAGRGENVWDIFDKGDYQSTTQPFDTSDIGTGLSPFEEKLATQGSGTSFGLESSNYDLGVSKGAGVRPPDFISQAHGSDKIREIGASQYSAGKISALDAGRHEDMLKSIGLQDRLSNNRYKDLFGR